MNEADEVKHYTVSFFVCICRKGLASYHILFCLCVTQPRNYFGFAALLICAVSRMSCETRNLGAIFGLWAVRQCSDHWSTAVFFYWRHIPKIWSRSTHLQTRIRSCMLLSPTVWTIVAHSAGTHHVSISCPGYCPSRYFHYGHLILVDFYYYQVGFILHLILHNKAFYPTFYPYFSYFYIIFKFTLTSFYAQSPSVLSKALNFSVVKHSELCFLYEFDTLCKRSPASRGW